MKDHSSEFEGVMKSVLAETRTGAQSAKENALSRTAGAPRSSRDKLANIGIFFGISVMTSVVIITQWTPAGVEPSRLLVHAVIAIAFAQLAIISGVSFKVIGRSSASKQRPARYVKAERRIEPRLMQPQPPALPVPKVERSQVSTGTLSGKSYVLFSDGSCEIDTMFGRRRFEDLELAREFVGG